MRRLVRSQWFTPRHGRLNSACCRSAEGVATTKQRLDRAVGPAAVPCAQIPPRPQRFFNELKSHPSLKERFTAIGGVGDLTAISILSSLPEIGTLPDGKLNRLVGIAPEEKQSGTKEWQRRIWGGRKDVRNALYMAAVASIKWNAILGGYYHKKRAEGHPHKWAIVPTMRKLLSLLNRIARDPSFIPMPEPESTKQNANVGRRKKAA